MLILALMFITQGVQASIPNLHQVDSKLYRGGQPENIFDYRDLAKRGIKTVINLRTTEIDQDRKMAQAAGLSYRTYPMAPTGFFSEQQLNQILLEIRTPENGVVFLHCKHGEDRTGLLVGIYRRVYQHYTRMQAFKEMIQLGFKPLFFGLSIAFWTYTDEPMALQVDPSP